jgi:hypothetical protein
VRSKKPFSVIGEEERIMAEEKSQAYIEAEKRVEAKLGFYKSLTTYLVVNLVLFLIDLFTSPGKWWFYWPLLFWGIGVFFHFIRVFVTGGLLSERVKEGMVRKELQKQEKKKDLSEI